ncbi:MAG TPA: hypothetical protein VF198_11810 [Vicinamibacterales bacterium]
MITSFRSSGVIPAMLLAACLAGCALPGDWIGGDGSAGEVAVGAGRDARLQPLRDLDGVFPFEVSPTPDAWRTRAEALRRQVRVALGLWPWPTRTPLNAVAHGAVDRGDYIVERVFFESVPGHFVTGSLYRPKGRTGRLPAVLSPHGHWPGGRFQDLPANERRAAIASGAERFDAAAGHVLQARAVQLARMGAIVFLYDMIGYADSVQIPRDVAHGGRRAPDPARDMRGLFYGPDAELHLQSIMGLQIWNGIRALDFLTARPDVDPSRIAVTGASGGATQTMMLGAIDERPAVAFPAVMVSTRMQGGCTCENADYLRIGTGNVELAALFAPKPLGMTAADDWTRLMPSEGYPELQRHYAMLGAPDHVRLFPFLQFGHNYNHVSRTAMYGWLNRHLGLGVDEPVLERDFVPLSRDEATVWTGGHPAPGTPGSRATVGEAHERELTTWWRGDVTRQLASLRPVDAASLARWRETIGGAVRVLLGRDLPEADAVRPALEPLREPVIRRGTLHLDTHGERVAFAIVSPPRQSSRAAVWTGSGGISQALPGGRPIRAIQQLVDSGYGVIVIDVLGQDAGATAGNRLVANRNAAAFTFGYNRPLVAQRAHDVLAALRYARTVAGPSGRVTLVAADGQAAAWAALARTAAGEVLDAAVFVTDGVRFADARSMDDAAFLPGSVRYGDLPALLALGAPGPLWVGGETSDTLAIVRDAYTAAGASDALTIAPARGDLAAGLRWLTTN